MCENASKVTHMQPVLGVSIKKSILKVISTGAVACLLSVTMATSANAFGMYEDSNYSGYRYNANWAQKDGLGTVNKKVSSISGSPGKWFYEGRGYTGRKVYISGSNSNLKKLHTNLPWYQSWNDRMQSYK